MSNLIRYPGPGEYRAWILALGRIINHGLPSLRNRMALAEKHDGGWLAILHQGHVTLTVPLGEMPRDQHNIFAERARYAATCLWSYEAIGSSFRIRKPARGRFGLLGGAINARPEYIISFCGYNDEHLNEAVALVLAVSQGLLKLSRAQAIANDATNPYFDLLYNLCR